jgi:uncharacterized protein (TIGR02001 family)
MKLNMIACAIGALVVSGTAAAEFSANIGVASNYVWRGATQTDDAAAVSGGIDYGHDSGFYVGTWASNVDFSGNLEGASSEVEWDLYGGYANELASGFGYDVGVIYYAYPDSDDANFAELALGVSYKFFNAGVNYTVSSDVKDTKGAADPFMEGDIYYYAGVSFDLPVESWTAGGTIGHYAFDQDGKGGGKENDLDYTHYQLDIGKSAGDFGDFTFSISRADEEANGGDDDYKVFVSWAKTFD